MNPASRGLEFSASGRVGVVEIGLVVDENGDVFPVIGLGIGYGDFGFGVGVVIADDGSPLSEYGHIAVHPDGTIIKTDYYPGDAEGPYVKVRYFVLNPDGSVQFEGSTGVGDPAFAAQMAAGLPVDLSASQCFLAGTPILLADGNSKRIESVVSGDIVLSYDANATIVAGRVTRTFRKEVLHLLDVHGLKATPGHVTLCGDGIFEGRHVPIIDTLLSDGALVTTEGDPIRMAINKPVGSVEDHFVRVAFALTAEDARAGQLATGEMRVGTLLSDREGVPVSVLDCLTAEGLDFDPDTGLVARPGQEPELLRWFGPLPRPEDYVLRRSRETLEGILTDGEWEGVPSALVARRLRHAKGMRVN